LAANGTQIPFDGFVMTKAGTINTQPVSMLRERVRSVGISLLGGNAGVEGPYELGIAEIFAVNEEDVTVPPRTLPHFCSYCEYLFFY
jgi:NADH dehydrogenase [ubiquinone] 1 alpha subcomplex assembly factor 1